MNYNDIDNDVLHYASRGLTINDLLSDHYGINPDNYTALLLLLPNDAEKRNEIHLFLQEFNSYLENGNHNSDRELGSDFEYSVYGITFYIVYTCITDLSRPFDDEEIVEASLINTELPEDAWNWLNYQCKIILSKWEVFKF